jgi:nitrogen-specific signal transduction histidine kinase
MLLEAPLTMTNTRFIHPTQSPDETASAGAEVLARQYGYFTEMPLIKDLLDAMPGIVLVLNAHRQVVFANRAFCELTGHQRLDVLCGHLVGDLLSCHVSAEADHGCGTGESCRTCGALTAMLSGISGMNNVQECTITRSHNDPGHSLTLRLWSAPLPFRDENFMVLAGIDISHEKRRLALERTFFHDILNLVGSIRGFAELIEIDDSVEPLEVSRRIQLASQRIIEEIDAQRVLLAAEKGELQVEHHVLVSKAILDEVITLYSAQEIARERSLVIGDDVDSCSLISDPTLLRRILGNMVKNALEASPPGGVVTLGTQQEGGELQLWVHNEAEIPGEYQQRIFQRDFSTKGTGRGLGTYSMKLMAQYLSGNVSFVSSKDHGTRFTLSLPIMLAGN